MDRFEVEERHERKRRERERQIRRNFKFAHIFQEIAGSPEKVRESTKRTGVRYVEH